MEKSENKYIPVEYEPLGFNPWRKEKYLDKVKDIIDVETNKLESFDNYDGSPENRNQYIAVCVNALLSEVGYRASKNQRDLPAGALENSEDEERYVNGRISPSEGLRLLHNNPELGSIELARHRHVGDWQGEDELINFVKTEFANDEDLWSSTVDISEESDVNYRIVGYGAVDPEAQNTIAFTRKREIFKHYPGSDYELVTVVVQTFSIDATSESFKLLDEPQAFDELLTHEFSRLNDMREQDSRQGSRNAEKYIKGHHNFLATAVSALERQRRQERNKININGIAPLTTAIYVTTRKARPVKEQQ